MDRCLAAVLVRWMNEKDDVKASGGATKGKLVSALKETEENALAEAIDQSTLGDLKVCIDCNSIYRGGSREGGRIGVPFTLP